MALAGSELERQRDAETVTAAGCVDRRSAWPFTTSSRSKMVDPNMRSTTWSRSVLVVMERSTGGVGGRRKTALFHPATQTFAKQAPRATCSAATAVLPKRAQIDARTRRGPVCGNVTRGLCEAR